ncbi:MAG: hypothetical protein R2753_15265 [Chitinophagales bacterium]
MNWHQDGVAIYFREGVSVEYLNELSRASNQWNQIIHCLGRLAHNGNNEAKIETIEKDYHDNYCSNCYHSCIDKGGK